MPVEDVPPFGKFQHGRPWRSPHECREHLDRGQMAAMEAMERPRVLQAHQMIALCGI
jgi:hypothetical protein